MKVSVKWGKTKLDVDLDPSEPPSVFKAQVFALTGVPCDRQKIMVRGGTLKDDADWATLGIKEGSTLMMIGSAEAAPAQATGDEPPVRFVEDLPDSDAAALSASLYPAGLTNLGNTCYMAATVQVLHALPELRELLRRFPPPGQAVGTDSSGKVAAALRDLSRQLSDARTPVAPFAFLQVLHAAYPQFAQRGNTGMLMQQDAEECWSQLFHALSNKLPALEAAAEQAEAASASGGTSGGGGGSGSLQRQAASALVQLFQGELVSRTEPVAGTTGTAAATTATAATTAAAAALPAADAAGAATVRSESFTKLACHIGGATNYLLDGLKASLDETLHNVQGADGQARDYTKRSRLNRLPYYLTVQFVRFFWKAGAKVKAKIVRPVEFPLELDVWDLCTPELQTQLAPGRRRLAEKEEDRLQQAKLQPKTAAAAGGKQQVVGLQQQQQALTLDASRLRNETGKYELTAVLTHKGREADSGHYVAFVKHAENVWLLFDDDRVSQVTNEDITRLSGKGGGDWHIAYMLFYKSKQIE